MIAAIHQPNYLPWMGYFDKMRLADVFVIFDDVPLPTGQHSYETRTFIGAQNGPLALNVPVRDRGKNLKIGEVVLADGNWRKKHLKSIEQAYGKTGCSRFLEEIFARGDARLCDMNVEIIRGLARMMGIPTRIVLSSEIGAAGRGTEKIVGTIKLLGADEYVSGTGKGSRRYVDEKEFAARGIKVSWHSYDGRNVSVVELWRNDVRGN